MSLRQPITEDAVLEVSAKGGAPSPSGRAGPGAAAKLVDILAPSEGFCLLLLRQAPWLFEALESDGEQSPSPQPGFAALKAQVAEQAADALARVQRRASLAEAGTSPGLEAAYEGELRRTWHLPNAELTSVYAAASLKALKSANALALVSPTNMASMVLDAQKRFPTVSATQDATAMADAILKRHR